MQIISLVSLRYAAIFVVVFTATGRAEDKPTPSVSQQELQAKIVYCKTCHGVSAQGFRGAFPIPRLAGSNPNILPISCALLLSADGQTPSCLGSRMF